MKIILVDYGNNGIIYVGDSLVVANQLKKGLVDTDVHALYPSHPGYNKINRRELYDNAQHMSVSWKTSDVADIAETARNSIYLERKRLCQLRAPIMEGLIRYTYASSITSKITVWDGFENNLARALSACDLLSSTFSLAVLEYAHINGITAEAAYSELKLQLENIDSIKMKVFSYQTYFVDRINQVMSEEDAAKVKQELYSKFTEDNQI